MSVAFEPTVSKTMVDQLRAAGKLGRLSTSIDIDGHRVGFNYPRGDPWKGGGQKRVRRLRLISLGIAFIGKPAPKGAGERTSPPRFSRKAGGSQA
jgi:hypothetical protein